MSLSNKITRIALLLALAVTVQQLKIQWLTGPGVNAILLLAAAYTDVYSASILGMITPVMALLFGVMPLAVVVPFIMVSNIVYIVIYKWQYPNNSFVAISMAAIVKFLVLTIAVKFIISVPPGVAYALSTPQLFTAVTGGIIATIIIRYLPLENALDKSDN
ncbi:MAG: hypothetical protein PHH19_02850 [Eubacteriales bacterium]|jgi:hypothetical protein|nr:hypothetical protein [Eubacteriales bacterium]NCC81855.1 ECF transporter S component [Clostridia bacterium]